MGLLNKIKQSSEILKDAQDLISKSTKAISSAIPQKESDASKTSATEANVVVPQACAADGVIVAEKGLKVPSSINTLEEMQAFLDDAQSNASSSIQSMLKVQMTVVRYIQSPTLIDSSLDTMIMALHESLEDTEEEKQQNELRKLFHRMLANYIFFMDARLKVEIENNREAGTALLAEAGTALAKSVVGVASLAATGPIGAAAVAKMTVKNVFGGGQKSLLTNTLKWYGAKREVQRKTSDFYESLINIIRKLDKYHGLIGRSILISGAIERYANAISEHLIGADIKEAQLEIKRLSDAINGKVNLNSMLNGLKSTAYSFITSEMPMGPLDRYKEAMKALEEAKLVQDENASRLINLSKNKDLERVRQCQEDVDTARKEVEAQIAKAQAQLDEATRRKEEYVKTIMDVASKYDEI